MNDRSILISSTTLLRMPLFEGVNAHLVVAWLDQCLQMHLAPGDPLVTREHHLDHAFVLLEGELSVHLEASSTSLLGTIQPGECVGEVSTLCRLPATAHVTAVAHSVVCRVPRDDLIHWARQSHQLALNLIGLMGQRLRSSNLRLSDEQQNRELLRTRSLTDPLTGVLNRGWCRRDQPEFQQLCIHGASPLSVLMIDIDHFKTFNDRFGHAAGDHVLRTVAERLLRLVRSGDVLIRWGGEEFLIVCADVADGGPVQRLAQRLCDEIAAEPFEGGDWEGPITVTVSIGVAHRLPQESWDALVKRADQALYAAKAAGRCRVVVDGATHPQA